MKINDLLKKINWNELSAGTPSNFHGDFRAAFIAGPMLAAASRGRGRRASQ